MAIFLGFVVSVPSARAESVRFGDVVRISGTELRMLDGNRLDHLSLQACAVRSCRPIPFQIDERDAAGDWILDHGPEPNTQQAAGVVNASDLLLFMAADAGDRALAGDLPSLPTAEIAIRDPLSNTTRWAYLIAYTNLPPRSAISYVRYDPVTDRVRGEYVSLGFHQGVPDYLALHEDVSGSSDGPNLLDRLKVRASATFLFGLIQFSRNEDDLSTQFVAWRQGPIRVIRRQRQWVRIGWGIRSPTFGSYTYFYREFAELPVSLRLNFPPRYFFDDIVVRAVLDFRDLHEWSVWTPSLSAPLPVDGVTGVRKRALNEMSDSAFALIGPPLTLVQTMDVSPSLASVRRHLTYDDSAAPDPPESVAGARPGIGFRLDRWEAVGAGVHQLYSVSYAVPPAVDVRAFVAALRTPLQAQVQPVPSNSPLGQP